MCARSPDETPHDGWKRRAAVRRQRHLELHCVRLDVWRRVLPVRTALRAEPLHQRRDLVVGLDKPLSGATIHRGEAHWGEGGEVRAGRVWRECQNSVIWDNRLGTLKSYTSKLLLEAR